MVQISNYGMIRRIRADASQHIQYFRGGQLKKSGRGLAFWFMPDSASIVEIPMDDRQLNLFLKAESADFQEVAIQGTLVWRVEDPEKLAERIDFNIDLWSGLLKAQPLDQLNSVLSGLVQRFAYAYLKQLGIREILEAGGGDLQSYLQGELSKDVTLKNLGIDFVGLTITALSPSSELYRALQTPTYESLQQQADEATFARRAMAVEKESAIAENELGSKIELATRQKELIDQEDVNARQEAETLAATMKITAEAEADTVRLVDQAKVDVERSRIEAYGAIPSEVLLAMAAQRFAEKLDRIDNLTISPDMLSGLLSQAQGLLQQRKDG